MDKVIFAFFFILSGFLASATENNICEDLYQVACISGNYDDGTGVLVYEERPASKNISSISLFAKKDEISEKIKSLLTNNDLLRQKALAAFDPQAACTHLTDVQLCNKTILAPPLIDYVFTMMTTGTSSLIVPKVSLEAKIKIEMDESLNQIIQENSPGFINKQAAKRIEQTRVKLKNEIFPKVKQIFLKKINELPITDAQKGILISRIKDIELSLRNSINLNDMYATNAHTLVENGKHVVTLLNGLLNAGSSEFTLVNVLAHELGHQIDPCQPQFQFPLGELLVCLRSSSSVEANVFDRKINKISKAPHPTSCNGIDQIQEAIPDWFAAEVTTRYIAEVHPHLTTKQWQIGVANMGRLMCKKNNSTALGSSQFNLHPSTKLRMNSIILQQPQIRKKMGCKKPHSQKAYCDANNIDEMNALSEKDNTQNKSVEPTNSKMEVIR